MKFNLKDFLELDTKSLLAVNGGTDCSGSSSPSSPSSPNGGGSGGPGSSTTSGYSSGSGGGGCSNTPSKPTTPTSPKSDGSNSSTSSGGGGCSGITSTPPTTNDTNGDSKDASSDNIKSQTERPNDDGTKTLITVYDDGKTTAITYDSDGNPVLDQTYYPTDTKGKDTKTGESVTSTDASAGASTSSESTDNIGTEPGTSSLTDVSQTDNFTTGTSFISGSNSSTSSNPSETTENGNNTQTPEVKSAVDKVMESIKNKGDNSGDDVGEKKKAYVKGVYQCDEYVEEMLTNARYDAKKYYVDDPNGKTVDTHIAELKKSGKNYETDCKKITEGVYVVFMADEQKMLDSHAALMFVNSDGSSFIYDNSSRNFYNGNGSYDGGIEKTKDTSVSNLCSQYSGYENFYFQKI